MPVARQTNTSLLVRVPHSSGMLEGVYNKDTKFDKDDHRSHRKKAWLEQGLQKIEQLKPFTEGKGRSLAQLAIQYILAHPEVTSLLPNIYNEEQLEEFAAAVDTPALSQDELDQIDALYDSNYGLERDMSPEKVAVKP
jgi:aryl-alcohol dehydrogenase-like predicted oxidoreductase